MDLQHHVKNGGTLTFSPGGKSSGKGFPHLATIAPISGGESIYTDFSLSTALLQQALFAGLAIEWLGAKMISKKEPVLTFRYMRANNIRRKIDYFSEKPGSVMKHLQVDPQELYIRSILEDCRIVLLVLRYTYSILS